MQFRPTAWHPSASAVCLGLGESNQERRLQFSGRAVRGASSLLFIHQQRSRPRTRARLACALGFSLRSRAPSAAAVLHAQLPPEVWLLSLLLVPPLFPPFSPPPVSGPWASALGPSAGRGRPRGCLPSPLRAGYSGSQVPGTPRTNFCCFFLFSSSAYLRAALSRSYLCAKGREPQSGGQRDFFLAIYPRSVCEHSL